MFDEQKLRWMNGRYLRELGVNELTARLEALLGRDGLRPAVEIARDKISTLDEFWPLVRFLYEEPADDPEARERWLSDPEPLRAARAALAATEPFDAEHVEVSLRAAADRLGIKPKQLFQPLRVAIAGTTVSPGIFESVVPARLRRDVASHRRRPRLRLRRKQSIMRLNPPGRGADNPIRVSRGAERFPGSPTEVTPPSPCLPLRLPCSSQAQRPPPRPPAPSASTTRAMGAA